MATDEPEVADIHGRLDEIARQIGAIQRAAAAGETDTGAGTPPASPPPLSLQAAIAEIAARQSELDRSVPPSAAPARHTREPDFSSLHQQLVHITSQIEALQPAQDIEQLIAHFRTELADIRKAVTEAVPSQAIESLQHEIHDLAGRIDARRDSGGDATTLAGIEVTLTEIRQTLVKLTPAEQLAGFDEAIRGLNHRLDAITHSSDDPARLGPLEEAIATLRSVVANIASVETLERLGADVQALGARIDDLVLPQFAAGPATGPSETFSHLEQRIVTLLERLEATNSRSDDLSRVETSLTEVLTRLERQRESIAALQHSTARQSFSGETPASDPALMETIKRELSDIRFSQSENDRQTQDALEAVHTTLGYVVDRLAMIEDDLRTRPAAPSATGPAPQTLPPRPELPNPVAAMPASPLPPSSPPDGPQAPPDDFPLVREALRHVAAEADRDSAGEPGTHAQLPAPLPRMVIDPGLPPDHPLEPGSRPAGFGGLPLATPDSTAGDRADAPASTTNFIAAARRAARAASAAAPETQTRRLANFAEAARNAFKGSDKAPAQPDMPAPAALQRPDQPGRLKQRIRALLVGTGIVAVALGGFTLAMTMIDAGNDIELTAPISLEELERAPEPTTRVAAPVLPQPAAPSLTSPEPLHQQARTTATAAAAPVAPDDTDLADATSAIPAAAAPRTVGTAPTLVSIPASETLPDGIGGTKLRTEALRGNPAAAYQVALRYAEGKGIAASHEAAFKWYRYAADGGIVPAMFRLGTFYEKGLGVKKDLDAARTQYQRAADRGNAKAMHNLAVLYADGGGNGADYRIAAQWFRKAATRGIADSQYNLAILYARGIGVEQNLAESYKWFSLAAAQGDADAGSKRDEIAKRLDTQSLGAARLAVQTFVAERQPDDAVNVPALAGG
jgi:localization factor PodJL